LPAEGEVRLAHPEEGPEDRVAVGRILQELEPFKRTPSGPP
jgi:hypothetical protein